MSSMTRVKNTTNSGSAVLKQFKLDRVDLEVCGVMVAPGSHADVPTEDWALQARSMERLIKLGALTVEKPAGLPDPAPALVELGWKNKKKKDEPSTEG